MCLVTKARNEFLADTDWRVMGIVVSAAVVVARSICVGTLDCGTAPVLPASFVWFRSYGPCGYHVVLATVTIELEVGGDACRLSVG